MTERKQTEETLERRGRTAMHRYRCSKPVAKALADGLISKETSFFDYGCGHGADIKFLAAKKLKAGGWDPIHKPTGKKVAADVVNLGYVLNVIENVAERRQTLRSAFALAKQLLVVAVRVDKTLEGTEEYADGVITDWGTFQKIYSQDEFRDFLAGELQTRPYLVAPGIAYVFKDPDAEARYVANRAFTRRLEYRTDLVEDFAKNPVARRFVRTATKLGRIPQPEEFAAYDKLLEDFGSRERIERLTLRKVNREAFDGSRAERRQDILTYFAMMRLQGLKAPKLSDLPPSVRADIKSSWSRYEEAITEADLFLFSMGRPDFVREACNRAPIGKRLPTDFYVHRSAEDDMPALLRLLVYAAKRIVGEVSYDLVKIATDGRAISFLSYKDFETDPHPVLTRSVKVYLPKANFGVRDYTTYQNPPILHRKDSFVAPSYPSYETFRQLTEAEEKAGLLSSSEIGNLVAWEALLKAHGLVVSGHDLVPAESVSSPTSSA